MLNIPQMDFPTLLSGFRENPIDIMEDAKKNDCSLSRYLDQMCPAGGERQDGEGKIPAFNAILREEGMACSSNARAGFYASRVSDFMNKEHHRMLFGELMYNAARKVWYAGTEKRAITLSDDATAGSMLRPFVDRMEALVDGLITPAIPLTEIVAFTNFISSRDYRSLYFDMDSEEARMVEITEGTDIPAGILKHQQNSIALPKKGKGIMITDEVMRDANVRIDRIMVQVELIALQAEADRVEDAVKVLKNGDGNANTVPKTYHGVGTAPTTAQNAIIPGETGTSTLAKAWTAFEMKFKSPFMLTRVLCREKELIELKFLNTGDNRNMLLELPGRIPGNAFFNTIQPINPIAPVVRAGVVEPINPDDASILDTNEYVGFDHRLALERLVEIGSEVQEMARFARNQTNFLGITENSNFAIYQPDAIRLLDVT